jgi:hypothetical protein
MMSRATFDTPRTFPQVVDVSDYSLRISDGHDGVLVQGGLQVANFLERIL